MIVIELTAAIDAAGTLQTFYLSTDPFVTTPSDTPANTEFLGVLENPGSFGTSVFTDGRTAGGAAIQNGEILIGNVDGQFDNWKDYSFDGRPVTVLMGDPEAGYPSSMTVLYQGTIESVELTWSQVSARIVDQQRQLQTPMLTSAYGGTNSLPNGIDGTANDIKSQKKPRVYGRVYNIQPQCVNTSLLIYQVSDQPVNDISAVYDRGEALTQGADYASNALLQAATGLTPGNYYTCKAEGLFRLASAPQGYPTADVTSAASLFGTARDWTVAQVAGKIADDAGYTIPSGDLNAIDAYTLTSGTYWECGIYCTDEITWEDALNQITQSVNACYFFDNTRTLRLIRVTVPSGAPVLEIAEDVTLPAVERVILSDAALPPWAVAMRHTKIYTVQDSDLAGGVSVATRAFLADEFRTLRAEDVTVKTKWLLAQELEAVTLFAERANGGLSGAEATSRLTLLKTNPSVFQVPVPLDIIQGASYKLLDVVSWTVTRFGMSSGKLFRLLGVDLELADNTAILLLWG